MSSSRSRDSIKNITNAVGHEGGPGTPFLRPRPKPAGGPRAVPELDGPGGSGWGDATSPSPAHPHAVAEDGAAGRPGGISRPIREDRGGMWVAPDELSSAPHSTAVRGGAVGGAAAASSEPPGLRRPEASHPPAGRPEPRATSPALPIAGAGGKRPALRDGSPAPGRVPQMAVGRGKRRRPDHRPRGAGTVHCARSHKPPRGFPPFELLYGRQPRGVLDVLRETWEEGPSGSKNEIQHVLDLRTKLHTLGQLSMENLLQAQDKQSRLYNRGTRLCNFAPGDKVLVLLPTSSSKLLAKWQGPFEVTR